MSGVRLVWDGKTAEVPRLRLPLQVVEVVNSPRADLGPTGDRCSRILPRKDRRTVGATG